MGKKSAADTVTIGRLGNILDLGERWLRKLENKGIIVRLARGQYDLPKSVQGYIKWLRETELAQSQTPAGSAKENFELERARKLKLENDQKEALLIETPEVIAAIDHIVGEIRTGLAGIPARFTEDLAERRRLENEIDAVLSQLADRFDQASLALREGRDPSEAYEANNA